MCTSVTVWPNYFADVGGLSLNVCPTYDGLTNTLESVEATWNDLVCELCFSLFLECVSGGSRNKEKGEAHILMCV